MTPKELLIATMKHEETGKVAWVPFAGVHAGQLIGCSAKEVLSDEGSLYRAVMEVQRLYKPCGLPIIFDLQVEAECMGCELTWVDDAPPSVKSHPLADKDELEVPGEDWIPKKTQGRIPMIQRVMKRVKDAIGDSIALYGLICGPFTLAAHLRGNDIFMDMFDDSENVERFLSFTEQVGKRMADYYIEAGMDVIAVVDPLISQISPNHFEEFMYRPYTALFSYLREQGALSSFFVCGDATKNIEWMCRTSPDAISVDENVDLLAAKKITDRYNICIGGNIPLTTVMLHGSQQDNMKFTIDLLDSMEDKRNFILSPGCDMPFHVPVENTIGVVQAVTEPDAVREMVKNYVAPDDDIEVLIPDYENLTKPLMEVFTLDSATCAACTYMMGAANEAKHTFGDDLDMVEYKFTIKENIARCKKMGVANLPSIYINGKLRFSSIVPSKEALENAVREVMK